VYGNPLYVSDIYIMYLKYLANIYNVPPPIEERILHCHAEAFPLHRGGKDQQFGHGFEYRLPPC
jgi:hypothetical protein